MPRFPKPFFKKSHQSWYVQFDGRQIRLGPDEKEAHRLYHELMTEAPKPPTPARGASPTLAEVFDRFLDFCRDQRAADTYEWYRWRLQMFLDEVAAELTIDRLKPFHLDDWFAMHPKWSSGTKHNMCRAVQRALRWAERRGRIDKSRSPTTRSRGPAGGRSSSRRTSSQRCSRTSRSGSSATC
jgi:hypothetical protein